MSDLHAARLRSEKLAIGSSCCGFTGEATLTESAVIILFAGMLGAGDMLALLTTSVLPLVNGLGILPMAYFVTRWGRRRLILSACLLASAMYFFAVCAPWFGRGAVAVLIGGIMLFALSSTGFISAWFPMLDSFLLPQRRTKFLGQMRFFHQLTATLFLFGTGLAIGKNPSLGLLQSVMFVAALIYCGRWICIAQIPEFPEGDMESPGWRFGLLTAMRNVPLTGFSIYQFILNLSVYGTVPLAILYMKNILHTPDNLLVLISGTTFSGMMLGYLCARRLFEKIGKKASFLLLHTLFLLTNIGMFFIGGATWAAYGGMTLILMTASFAIAAFSILASAEMMELATPGNKTMAMAFCGAFYYTGAGVSRLAGSFILGMGVLTAEWELFGMVFCRYKTLFLLYSAGTFFAALCLILVPAVTARSSSR